MKKWIIVALIVVVAGGAAAYYFGFYRQASAADPAPVATAKVERGLVRLVVASNGRVVSKLDVDVKCKASGEINDLPFADVSLKVKEGELLLSLDPVDMQRIVDQEEASLTASQAKLISAQQNLIMAEQALVTDRQRADVALKSADVRAKDARSKSDRMKQLLEMKLCSQEEYDTAETAAAQADADLMSAKVKIDELKTQEQALEVKRQDVKLAEATVKADTISLTIAKDRLADTKLLAPITGVIAVLNVQKGQIISSGISNVGGGTTIMTLSDLSQMYVLASVDESDIGKIAEGQAVEIKVDAYPGKTFAGSVVRKATRGVNLSNVVTFEVKIEITSPEKDLLKPEMTAYVEILAAAHDSVLLVPVESIVRKGREKTFVTILKDDKSKEDVPVKVGISDGNKTEVSGELAEGAMVVVNKGSADSKFNANNQKQGGQQRPLSVPGKR
jgi:RND family efflux transporter MFP subunit